MAIKVEKQLKQKGTVQQSQPLGPSKPWKANTRGDPSQKNEDGKAKQPREKKDTSTIVKGNNVTPTYNRDIKCFHCLSFGNVLHSVQIKDSLL